MMYINFDRVKFTPRQYFFLCAISQQTAENNMEDTIAIYLDEDTDNLIEEGYIDSRKPKRKDESELSLFKITKKGKDALKKVSERSEPYDEDDTLLENWLYGIYSKRPNYEKSNREQTKRMISWFKHETDIQKNELSNLLLCFLNDTFVTESNGNEFWNEFNEAKLSNKRLQLSNKLEYVLWKPKDRFARHPKLEESPLYQYYQENKAYIDDQYKKRNEKK